jgi:hypothetical protein
MTAPSNSVGKNFEYPTHIQQRNTNNGEPVVVLESTDISEYVTNACPFASSAITDAMESFAVPGVTLGHTIVDFMNSDSTVAAMIRKLPWDAIIATAPNFSCFFTSPDGNKNKIQ